MLLASIRRNFTSATVGDFADEHAFQEIQEPKIDPEARITEKKFLAKIARKKVLVLVHGYRNPAGAAVKAYWKVQEMLGAGRGGYDQVIGYLWPGGWFRLSFPLAKLAADRTSKRFYALLQQIAQTASVVDLQVHSLGARVALEALDRGGISVRNLWLAAPAVDDEVVESREEYAEACRQCDRVYVMHSRHDGVLQFAYRVGDVPEFDNALGWKGPQRPAEIEPNVKVADCQDVVVEHGGYRDAPEVFDYWLDELASGGAPQFTRLKKSR